MRREDGDYVLTSACGDKRFGPTWLLVQLVYFAAWLVPPRGRHRR